MAVALINNKTHLVIKRNGSLEKYNPDKLRKVILWAAEDNETFTDQLLQAIDIKIYNKIHITKLYDEVIETASNLISDLYPFWETIAKNLYRLKLHKELDLKRTDYPNYRSIIDMNVSNGFYDKDTITAIADYIQLLETVIQPERDNLFTFGGLNLFVQKYCNKTKTKLLELPQHTYMRIAVQLMHKDGIDAIIDKYNQLSTFQVTEGTPKVVNALKHNPQQFSCCLARPTDSLESINGVADLLSRESKFGGGLATDVSSIRASGAIVEGNKGMSGGVVPFIKGYQELVGAYNQGSTRSSAMCVYYNWYHYQSPEITMLKDEAGKDEDRARKLKYAVKWTHRLTEAIHNDEKVHLFDPHKCQDMTYAYGDTLDTLMDKHAKNTHIRKRTIPARELAMTLATLKIETGNNYTFFTDNANIQNIGAGPVWQSNLCMEFIPNFETIELKEEYLQSQNYGEQTLMRSYTGDIALCNLSSINIMEWCKLTTEQKEYLAYTLVKSMDNAIDVAFYANELGKKHSIEHRNIGVGISNYANYIASNKLLWSDEAARKLTHELMEEISYYTIKASIRLAKERGPFLLYTKSKWSQGVFPHELSLLPERAPHLIYPLLMDWESLRKDLLTYGIRNEYCLAIAPTATSGKCINATYGVDAPRKFKTIEEGTYSLPFIVPNLKQNRDYYRTIFETSNVDTIELAAIRQRFIDMGQSVSLAYKDVTSAYAVIKDIMYAEELGLKSLYYTHSPTQDDVETKECEGCAS